MKRARLAGVLMGLLCLGACSRTGGGPVPDFAAAARPVPAGRQQLAILDTDIGDDIDDAFALALVLRSPEIKLLGITTDFGDTELRARLADRYLAAVGHTEIPVAAGKATTANNVFTQKAYAAREPERKHADGVAFMLEQIKQHPGEVTLIAIGPLVNVGEAIKRDGETFRKLKRVVMMGGSVYRGYDTASSNHTPPQPEWNIARNPEGAQALLASGVAVYMMPLDSTEIQLGAAEQQRIYATGAALTDQLTLLYHQWAALNENHASAPTLFDPVAVAYAVRQELCPVKPMRIEVDGRGMTRAVEGKPNAQVCLQSDERGFLDLLLGRIAEPAH